MAIVSYVRPDRIVTFTGLEPGATRHSPAAQCHLFGAKANPAVIKQLRVIDCQFVDVGKGPTPLWQCCSFKNKLIRETIFENCAFDRGNNAALAVAHGDAEDIRFVACRFGSSGYWLVDLLTGRPHS